MSRPPWRAEPQLGDQGGCLTTPQFDRSDPRVQRARSRPGYFANNALIENALALNMAEVHQSAIVAFSAVQMFALVNDVPRYPEFLPWCEKAECFVQAYQLPAAREGYSAFFEKRQPRWQQT